MKTRLVRIACLLGLLAMACLPAAVPARSQSAPQQATSPTAQDKQRAQKLYKQTVAAFKAVPPDREKVIACLRQAIALDRANAAYVTQLAAIYRAFGRFAEGVTLLETKQQEFSRSEDIQAMRIALADMQYEWARSLKNQYQFEQAIAHYQAAYAIDKTIHRKDAGIELSNIGFIYNSISQYQKALGYYEQALAIHREVKDRSGEGTTLNNLMVVWDTHGNPALAIFYGKQAVNVKQAIRQDIRGLDKTLQQGYLNANVSTYRDLADALIAVGRLPEAQQVLNLLKQEEFFEFVRRDQTVAGLAGQTDLTPREAEWEQKYRLVADRLTVIGVEFGTLQKKRGRTAPENARMLALTADLETATTAFKQFLRQLETEFSRKAPQADRRTQLKDSEALASTLAHLPGRSVALYTLAGEKTLRLLLVTPDTQIARSYPIAAAALNKKVQAFREALQNPRLDPRPLGKELYDILIGPVAKDLEGAQAETLMWSLDGTLRYLPIEALWDGKQYLLQRFRSTVFTPASLGRLASETDPNWTMLGLGVSKAHPGFSALPAVPEELRGIVRQGNGGGGGVLPGTALLDEAFTLLTLKAALLNGYKALHIASHFAFRPGDETHSFLLLGDGTPLSLADFDQKLPSALFRGVELICLSACDTAIGSQDADGREIDGLGMLAQRKGADAVLASLWPVADASTRVLMQTFYRIRQTHPGLPKVEALRQAQMALLTGSLRETGPNAPRAEAASGSPEAAGRPLFPFDAKTPYAHPYYWAPFILIGNWK